MSATRRTQVDLRTLVVSLDKQHKAAVPVYHFANRKFYDKPRAVRGD